MNCSLGGQGQVCLPRDEGSITALARTHVGIASGYPLKRGCTTDEIANVALFLAPRRLVSCQRRVPGGGQRPTRLDRVRILRGGEHSKRGSHHGTIFVPPSLNDADWGYQFTTRP